MKYVVILCFFYLSCTCLSAQYVHSEQNWKTFTDFTYESGEDEYGEVYIPLFGKKVKALEGAEVTLKGYIVPFEGLFEPDHIILSSLPIASCFFCGGGGAETVAEIYLKEKTRFTTKLVTVVGRLKLNNTDFDQLMYVLLDAKIFFND